MPDFSVFRIPDLSNADVESGFVLFCFWGFEADFGLFSWRVESVWILRFAQNDTSVGVGFYYPTQANIGLEWATRILVLAFPPYCIAEV